MPDFNDEHAVGDAESVRRKRSNVQRLFALGAASALLIVFIFALGDFRRKQNAMTFVADVVRNLQERVGPDKRLPLNLRPNISSLGGGVRLEVEWLPESDARLLRDSTEPVLAAQTQPLPLALTRNGRVVVWFQNGAFWSEWLSLSEFEVAASRQTATLARSAPIRHNPASQPTNGS